MSNKCCFKRTAQIYIKKVEQRNFKTMFLSIKVTFIHFSQLFILFKRLTKFSIKSKFD